MKERENDLPRKMYEGNSKTMCYLFYIKFMYFLNRYYIHMVQNSKGIKEHTKD